jgi:integrase
VPTFGDIAEEWFKSKLDRRPFHVFDLRTRLDKQILPAFEKEKLDRITVAAVEKFRDKLRDEKHAQRTIQILLREANPGYERTLFETAYLTGAREGELLALRWTDL